jgi:GDP-4-dehydro-6-deoxy-D-mannose reductase
MDACNAYCHLLDKGVIGETYNVCSGITHSIDQLIAMASASVRLKLEVKVSQEITRENDQAKLTICGNPRKLMALGWIPRLPMEELIPAMITHYRTGGANTPIKTSF